MPIIKNLASAQYHSDKATVSKHGLDNFAKAPAYFRHKLDFPEESTNPAFRWGTLVHLVVLEPHNWDKECIVMTEKCDRRTVKGKEAFAAFSAQAAGRIVVTKDEEVQLQDIAASVHAHPVVQGLFNDNHNVEDSVYWRDETTGQKCRCRPDLYTSYVVADLKTCNDASDYGFGNSAAAFRYHVQDSFYIDGLRANGIEVEKFIFIAVETKAPYLVRCLELADISREAGRAAYKRDLSRLVACAKTNTWPGLSREVGTLKLPSYADGMSELYGGV